MDHESMKAKTFHKLKVQRVKEIQRQGVLVTYHYTSYPFRKYFEFAPIHKNRLLEMTGQSYYNLELTDAQGITIQKLKPNGLYFSKQPQDVYRLLISSETYMHHMVDIGSRFYLCKSNPTLDAYKENYSQDRNEYQSLDFYQSSHIVGYFKGETYDIYSPICIEFPYQDQFNENQNEAIAKCGRNSLTFIKGPPGCGKTKTIGRICRLFLQQQLKVIVGAVSNTGNLSIVRQLIEELSPYNNHSIIEKYYLHYGQTFPQIYYQLLANEYQDYIKCSLVFYPPFQIREEDLPPLIRVYSFDTLIIINMINESKETPVSYLISEYKKLKAKQKIENKFYAIFMQAVSRLTSNAQIIVATTVKSTSINSKIQPAFHFKPSVAILDEASQSSISDTLCYLKLNIQKLILVGDEKQLNPTVISNDLILKQSFFMKFSQNKKQYFTMLNQQYRMHPDISCISNQFFYENQIKDAVTSLDRQSNMIPFNHYPVLFINCSHLQNQELENGNKKNYVNYHEVYIVKEYLKHFPYEELKNVGIITPYGQQLKIFQKEFAAEIKDFGLTVKTCDGFQGGEKDYIFISLVRSNLEGNIGFCGEENRINVSITRARRGMMIVGNSLTFLKNVNYWGMIINHVYSINRAYFNFEVDIPQAEIDKIIANYREKKEIGNEGDSLPQSNPNCLTYDQYRTQYLQSYPSIDDETIQYYYFTYVHQLQFQQNDQSSQILSEPNNPINPKSKIIELLQSDNNKEQGEAEDEDEIESFIKKNKVQAKYLRRLHFLRVGNNHFDKTAKEYISEIFEIYEEVPNEIESISKRLTKSMRQVFTNYLQDQFPINPLEQLEKLITQISSRDYKLSHMKGSENLYLLIKWMLLKKLYDCL